MFMTPNPVASIHHRSMYASSNMSRSRCPLTEHPCKIFPASMIRYNHVVNQRRRAPFRCSTTGKGISVSSSSCNITQPTKESPYANIYQQAMSAARTSFTQEISFQKKDKDISLAKTLLYIAAEDEAFIALNKEIDACSLVSEMRNFVSAPAIPEWNSMEQMPLDGHTIAWWLSELDIIADEVKSELASRDIGCDFVEVLDAVNAVLFGSRGFKRAPVVMDSKHSYLHSVLSSGRGSAIVLSVIYMEVCKRINIDMVGSRVGEEFLIWPETRSPEVLFCEISGRSLFATVNGECVEDPKSRASDLTSSSLVCLEIASKRVIIGIALANLIRLHWKRASRSHHGLMLTSPLRDAGDSRISTAPSLRTQDLRLAMMATERLLALQPHNWALRRDYGMMLYYSREYGAAVREVSICMALAPEEEVEILGPFVEKLHLLRLESSWIATSPCVTLPF